MCSSLLTLSVLDVRKYAPHNRPNAFHLSMYPSVLRYPIRDDGAVSFCLWIT